VGITLVIVGETLITTYNTNIKTKEKKKAKEKEVKILYFGGQKSGKSRLAEMRALSLSKNRAIKPYYIANMITPIAI